MVIELRNYQKREQAKRGQESPAFIPKHISVAYSQFINILEIKISNNCIKLFYLLKYGRFDFL